MQRIGEILNQLRHNFKVYLINLVFMLQVVTIHVCLRMSVKCCLSVQTVRDTYPPNENYIALERLVALAVRPFLGYQGLYDGDTEPIVKSRTYNFVVQYTDD